MPTSQIRRLRDYWVFTGHRLRLTKELEPRIASLRGSVLDVGGGRGSEHDRAWDARTHRIRLDISANHRPDVLGDAASLPIADASVDAVVMFEVLEHLPDPSIAIREAHRVLVQGGTFLGSAPFVWPIHGDPHDYFRFSADALRNLLSIFDTATSIPLGNAAGGAWVLLSSRSRTLRALNPLMRRLGKRPDPKCPQAYVFTATK
jgi:SAM-dependent methyltransferase